MDRRLYTFDEFAVDPLRRVLLFRGQPVAIMPKALSTLLVLLERPGAIVAKDELLNRVWPDTTASEASLSQAIFWLRKSLSDHAEGRRYVVTVPGQGFTFAAEVRAVTPAPAPAPEPSPAPPAEPPPVEPAPPAAAPAAGC